MRRFLLLLCISLILFTSCTKKEESGNEPLLILRYADNQPEYYPTTKAARYFAALVKERTNGKLLIEVYGNGKLGDEKSTLAQITFGGIDFSRFSLGTLTDDYPELSVLQLPYLYDDTAHMWRVLDSEIGNEYLEIFPPDSMVGLCWLDAGARSFYSTRQISSPSDLQGLDIRVQESELISSMMTLLGANALQIAYENVYSALKQNLIDGAENNLPSYLSMQHYQVAKYMYMDEHFRIPEVVVMSAEAKRKVEALDPSYMGIIKECAKAASRYEREQWQKAEEEALSTLTESGCIITYPSLEDKEQMREIMNPIYDLYTGHDKAIIAQILLKRTQ